MASRERRIAHALRREIGAVPRDDEAVGSNCVGRRVIAVAGRIEIENASILFRQASVIVEAETGADAQVGTQLKLVLKIRTRFVRPVVAVGIALQEIRGNESISGIADGRASEEIGEIQEADHARICSFIARVELGIGKTSAEGQGVFAEVPNRIGGGHPAILEYAGECALRSCRRADVQATIENEVCIGGGIIS